KVHRCPSLRDDPSGYLAFVCELLTREKFDVLVPIHEQGLVFARTPERVVPFAGVALPSFDSYRLAHGKAGFARPLAQLGWPPPPAVVVGSVAALRAAAVHYPCVIKTAVGTASRGTWMVRGPDDLVRALGELTAQNAFDDEVLVQDLVTGPVEHAQRCFGAA